MDRKSLGQLEAIKEVEKEWANHNKELLIVHYGDNNKQQVILLAGCLMHRDNKRPIDIFQLAGKNLILWHFAIWLIFKILAFEFELTLNPKP